MWFVVFKYLPFFSHGYIFEPSQKIDVGQYSLATKDIYFKKYCQAAGSSSTHECQNMLQVNSSFGFVV